MDIYTIYRITNLSNNKVYIGYTSKSSVIRFKMHIASHNQNRYNHIKLYRAFKKYGVENFICEDLYLSKDKNHIISKMEQYFIEQYNSIDDRYGYNMCVGGRGGLIKTKEQLLKDSIRYSGNNNPIKILQRKNPEKYKYLCDKRDKLLQERFLSGDNYITVKIYVINLYGLNFFIMGIKEVRKFCKKHKIANPTIKRGKLKNRINYISWYKYKVKSKNKSSINYKKFIEDYNKFTKVVH